MFLRFKCICFLGFLAMSFTAGNVFASPSSKAPELTSRGYSIFDGTMADMTYVQIEKAAKEKAIIIFPVGVIEEHGPHLPLGVDTYGAYLQAKLIKGELEKKGIPSLIAPPFYWGINNATGSFAGSFTVREETMVNVLWDAMASLKRWGFEKVFFTNHHGDADHNRALLKAIEKARVDTGIRAYYVLEEPMGRRLGLTGKEPHILMFRTAPPPPSKFIEVHAGGGETSFMWHYFPDLVDLEIWKTLKSTDLTLDDLMIWRRGWQDARKVTPQGYFGDPTTASPERGKKSKEDYGKAVSEVIEKFLSGQYKAPEMK